MGVDDVSKPSNKLSVVRCIPEISTYFFFISMTRPFLDALDFLQVSTDSLIANYVSQ